MVQRQEDRSADRSNKYPGDTKRYQRNHRHMGSEGDKIAAGILPLLKGGHQISYIESDHERHRHQNRQEIMATFFRYGGQKQYGQPHPGQQKGVVLPVCIHFLAGMGIHQRRQDKNNPDAGKRRKLQIMPDGFGMTGKP